MPLSERDNFIRAVRRTGPEWIPCRVMISASTWLALGKELEDVLDRHRWLFPDFRKGAFDSEHFDPGLGRRAGERFTDNWGCVWDGAMEGIWGQCVHSPLEDWKNLEDLRVPDPLTEDDYSPIDWESIRREVTERRKAGQLTFGGTSRYPFSRLWYLRGFENLMTDFISGEPRLRRLIEIVVEHMLRVLGQWFTMDLDYVSFGDDFGTQTQSFISPRLFHEWITPVLHRLFKSCKERNLIVHLHSDGYIMELVDDLIEAGADVINPQDLCNGIDALQREAKGRVCINLDIDRQTIVPFGTRKDIHDLVQEEVMKLGSAEGGLMFTCDLYPPTTPENIDAVLDALTKFSRYWSRT